MLQAESKLVTKRIEELDAKLEAANKKYVSLVENVAIMSSEPKEDLESSDEWFEKLIAAKEMQLRKFASEIVRLEKELDIALGRDVETLSVF